MAKNEIDEKVVEEAEEVPEIPDGEEDTTDYKALAFRNQGIAKRNATRLKKLKELGSKIEEPVTPIKTEKKEGFDYAEKAYLKGAGIKPSEYDLVQGYIDAGKTLDDILDEDSKVGKLFHAELKAEREEKATKDAIPAGSKRSAPSARDTVEYHLANNTPLREIKDVKLRREVQDAKIKQSDGTTGHFYNS